MSEHGSHSSHDALAYETTDVHTGPIYKFVFALVGLMLAGIVVAYGIFTVLELKQTEDYQNLRTTTMQEKSQRPPGPLLQVTNHDDLLQFRADQAKDVDGHATWLDKNAKVVRLPISRAIDLVAEHGLPVFKAEPAPKEGTAPAAAPKAGK